MPRNIWIFCCLIVVMTGCASPDLKNPYDDAFQSAGIRSILIVPAVNRSVHVDASWILLTTLPELLAESGYYVFPVNTVKVVLEHEGLYEADAIHALEPSELANMFEADSILYITINNWETKYVLVDTVTQLNLSYRLVSRSGEELWRASKHVQKNSVVQTQGGGLLQDIITNAVGAVIEKATVNYRPLAEEANQAVFVAGETQLPDGPYLVKAHQKNSEK